VFQRVTLISPQPHIVSTGRSSFRYGRTNDFGACALCKAWISQRPPLPHVSRGPILQSLRTIQ
jgi:hypothetical protein